MFKPNQVKVLISIAILLFTLFLLVSLIFFDIPKDNKDLVNMLLGAIVGWIGSIVSFYFGSTDKENRETNRKDL